MAEQTHPSLEWSVELFSAFWANPEPGLVGPVLTEDVVGHWPGLQEPVVGREAYTACIAAAVETLPDLKLEVAEHARSGDFFFIRWIMHATGDHGPFEGVGVDRIRVRDGLVAENLIVFDTAAYQARSGKPIPWAAAQPIVS